MSDSKTSETYIPHNRYRSNKALKEHIIGTYKLTQTAVSLENISKEPLVFSSVDGIDSLLEGVDDEDGIPFWAEIWDSALGLAQFLVRQPMKGRTVLELGCGVGVSGICAAACGSLVTQVDYQSAALDFCRYNMLENNVTGVAQVLGDIRKLKLGREFDYIIGSDILYEPKLHSAVIRVMESHLNRHGTSWFADPGRKWASLFLERVKSRGWIYDIDEVCIVGKAGKKNIDVLTLKRR